MPEIEVYDFRDEITDASPYEVYESESIPDEGDTFQDSTGDEWTVTKVVYPSHIDGDVAIVIEPEWIDNVT